MPRAGVLVLQPILAVLFCAFLAVCKPFPFYLQSSTFHFPTHHAPQIAPSPQPEYPLFSPGGLQCASVWQGKAASLASCSQLFFAVQRPRNSPINSFNPIYALAPSG